MGHSVALLFWLKGIDDLATTPINHFHEPFFAKFLNL